ncbi:pre-mrna branch site protein p14 [Moniliophthora roreri]|nr:pre-mrna branch site protein p14 [Moniliophthora roreri]
MNSIKKHLLEDQESHCSKPARNDGRRGIPRLRSATRSRSITRPRQEKVPSNGVPQANPFREDRNDGIAR